MGCTETVLLVEPTEDLRTVEQGGVGAAGSLQTNTGTNDINVARQ